jgi:hypothetical protein
METDKEREKRADVKTPEPRYGAHGGVKTMTGGMEYDIQGPTEIAHLYVGVDQ